MEKRKKTIRFTEEHDAKLKAHAQQTGLSEADIVNLALDNFFGISPISIPQVNTIVAEQTKEIDEKFSDLKKFIKKIHE